MIKITIGGYNNYYKHVPCQELEMKKTLLRDFTSVNEAGEFRVRGRKEGEENIQMVTDGNIEIYCHDRPAAQALLRSLEKNAIFIKSKN